MEYLYRVEGVHYLYKLKWIVHKYILVQRAHSNNSGLALLRRSSVWLNQGVIKEVLSGSIPSRSTKYKAVKEEYHRRLDTVSGLETLHATPSCKAFLLDYAAA